MTIYVIAIVTILVVIILYKCTYYNNTIDDKLVSGMMGSFPSDKQNVYDSKNPISLPADESIDDLLESFKENGLTVYKDFKKNKNSKQYKMYITDGYKLDLLLTKGKLNRYQKNRYYEVDNYITNNINDIINYHLDNIKYKDNNYTIIKKIIYDCKISKEYFNSIVNYVLSSTDIPSNVVILIKYKLSNKSRRIFDQFISVMPNYTSALNILEHLLSNGTIDINSLPKDINQMNDSFWNLLYTELIDNNITMYIIKLITQSYMSDDIYYNIIYTFLSTRLDIELTNAVKNINYLCTLSDFILINTFPYKFTYVILLNAF